MDIDFNDDSQVRSLTNTLNAYRPNETDLDTTDLIVISSALRGLQAALLQKQSEILKVAAKRDPNDFLPHLRLARLYTIDFANELLANEHITSCKALLNENEPQYDEYAWEIERLKTIWRDRTNK